MRYHDLIDRIDGFTIGTIIVENGVATLETKTGEINLDEVTSIEVLNGADYVSVTAEDCRVKLDSITGWPLFAGMYARVRLN
jgi:hypothetical protein